MNAEKAVLGSCMVEQKAVITALSMLKPEHFNDLFNREVFEIIKKLHKKGSAIDVITITETVPNDKKKLVMDMHKSCQTAVHVEHYAKILIDKYLKADLVSKCAAVAENPGDKETISTLIKSIKNLSSSHSSVQDMESMLREYTIVTEERIIGNDMLVKTGFMAFDRMTQGFRVGSLVAIGGRPNSGKTSFLRRLAVNSLLNQRRILYISGESTAVDLLDGMIAMITKQSIAKIGSAGVKDIKDTVFNSLSTLSKFPLYTKVTGHLSMPSIESSIDNVNPDIVMVDYINRFVPDYKSKQETRAAFYGDIAHGLKNIAIERKIIVVVACQLNRETAHRTDGVPVLSDFRESGGIEEAAHMAILLHPKFKERNELARLYPVDLIIAKNKGPMGKIEMMFDEKTADFIEINQPKPTEEF